MSDRPRGALRCHRPEGSGRPQTDGERMGIRSLDRRERQGRQTMGGWMSRLVDRPELLRLSTTAASRGVGSPLDRFLEWLLETTASVQASLAVCDRSPSDRRARAEVIDRCRPIRTAEASR